MAGIERIACPRFQRLLAAQDLQRLFGPAPDELDWVNGFAPGRSTAGIDGATRVLPAQARSSAADLESARARPALRPNESDTVEPHANGVFHRRNDALAQTPWRAFLPLPVWFGRCGRRPTQPRRRHRTSIYRRSSRIEPPRPARETRGLSAAPLHTRSVVEEHVMSFRRTALVVPAPPRRSEVRTGPWRLRFVRLRSGVAAGSTRHRQGKVGAESWALFMTHEQFRSCWEDDPLRFADPALFTEVTTAFDRAFDSLA